MYLLYSYIIWQMFMGTVKMKAISSGCQVGECMFKVSVWPFIGPCQRLHSQEAQERRVLLSNGKGRVLLSGSVGAY